MTLIKAGEPIKIRDVVAQRCKEAYSQGRRDALEEVRMSMHALRAENQESAYQLAFHNMLVILGAKLKELEVKE